MKYRYLITFFASLLFFNATTVYAENTTQREQVEILFKLTQMEKQINQSVDNIVQLELRQKPQLTNKKQALTAFINKNIGWKAIKEDLAEMYMKMFTAKELKTLNDFYITPAGQKVITEMPKLVQQRNQLAMKRLQKNVGELKKILE